MNKVLVAIVSCARDTKNGFNAAVRNTWVKNLDSSKADCYFVLGEGASSTHWDEIVVPAKDDYPSLPDKTYALLSWAVGKEYTHIFKCDTDTYVNIDRVLNSDFRSHDYIGFFNGPIGISDAIYHKCYSWASGGSGYWLSWRAAQYVVSNPPDHRALCPELKLPCEDLWVGQVLGPKIREEVFTALHDPRYHRGFYLNSKVEFSAHYCSEGMNRTFNPSWMYRHHEANK